MTSFVYFKFKSEKEPTRIAIDGPHTDVWNLKREIIAHKRLGDGTDFDLKIFKENSNEEYTDDTEIVPKDSTVLARRLPASAPGKGRAARYVSGKPPATAKPATSNATMKIAAAIDSATTEEEKLKAMMKMQDAQWQQRQEEMSHDARINIVGQKGMSKKANVPEGEPPHGYVCYRCGQKGHWIQACPTNDDASYDGKPKIKKTTGIPRSMLQKVDKSDIENLDEQQRQNVMITSEGEYVLAQADKKTWQKFQDQKNATDAAKRNVSAGDEKLQELGLECPIDKRMFVDPMKTPCCGKTYCHECIENALLDNDLQCPNCHTENVSLEGLESDEDAKNKIKELSTATETASPAASAVAAAASPEPQQEPNSDSRPTSRDGNSPKSPSSVAGRKRTASEATETKDNLEVPVSMKRQKSSTGSDNGSPKSETTAPEAQPANNLNTDFQALMAQMSQAPMNMNMPFMPMMNPMMMNMMGNMPMNMPMQNFNMNNGFNQNWNNNGGGYNQYNQQGFNGHQNGQGNFNNRGYRNKKFNNNFQRHNASNSNTPPAGLENAPKGPKAMNGTGIPTGPSANKFSNQQQYHNEDSAYQRQPVNPQRAMNRGTRKGRTADFREVGSQ